MGALTSNLDSIIPANNFGNGNPSMDSSWTYQPETSFNDLVGCPLNGDWTIFVQDNLSLDDGWIFEWSVTFDTSYYAVGVSYENFPDTSWWSADPTILFGFTDTSIIVLPQDTGLVSYTFNVMNDYGCVSDTTVSFVVDAPATNIEVTSDYNLSLIHISEPTRPY